MGIAHRQGRGQGFLFQPSSTRPINQLIAHYAQPIVPLGQVKIGRANPTRPIDNPYLRFIHLVQIPSRLFSKLHQGFPFKIQMNSHKCILNLKLHLSHQFNLLFPFGTYRSSAYHSSFGAKHSHLPFGAYQSRIYHSHQKFLIAILNYPSTILRLSTINRRVGFIKNSSRKHTES